jgi:hypothetical protein
LNLGRISAFPNLLVFLNHLNELDCLNLILLLEPTTKTLHRVYQVNVRNLVGFFGVHHLLVEEVSVVQAYGQSCDIARVQLISDFFGLLVEQIRRIINLFDLCIARVGF